MLYIQFPNDNRKLGELLGALVSCKIRVSFSIRHTVKDPEAVKNELLGKAIEDSKIKAEVLSKAAGISLGEIKTIDYSWGELEIYSQSMRNIVMEFDATSNLMLKPDGYDLNIEAKDIDVVDTVMVVWEIK